MKPDENKLLKEAKELKKVANNYIAGISFILAAIGGVSFLYGVFTFFTTDHFTKVELSYFIFLFCGLGIFLIFFPIFLLMGLCNHIFKRIELLELKIGKKVSNE